LIKNLYLCCQKAITTEPQKHAKNTFFCGCKKKMSQYNNIKNWVEDLPKRGKTTFSKEDATLQFPNLSNRNIQDSLHRLISKNKIYSVWQGFYAIVLPEYGLRGIVPPMEYIDQLMRFLGKDYYVALLSAAELHGAAHQAPQEFYVMCNTTKLRSKLKNGVKINFIAKKNIPQEHCSKVMTKSGYVDISNPILTAYDLIYYTKNVGGISRIGTIINELAEKIRFIDVDKGFMQSFPSAATQRLGYIFEELEFVELADKLYRKAEIARLNFRKTPLVIENHKEDLSNYPVNDRWKIIINEQIEID